MALCASAALPGCVDLLGDYSIADAETCTCKSNDCAASECLFWARSFGDGDEQFATGVAVDAANDIVLVGDVFGSIDFSDGVRKSAGDSDVFVAKLGAQGGPQWSVRFGNAGADHATSVAVDPDGNVLVTGYFTGTVDFGGEALTSLGGSDAFVLKLGPDGEVLWVKSFGGGLEQYGIGIATDSRDNVIVGGCFHGTTNFGNGIPATSLGEEDVFVLKLGPNGEHLWHVVTGNVANDCASRVATDTRDNIVVSGNFATLVDFGGAPLAGAGSLDTFLVALDPDGKHRWSQKIGDAGMQLAGSLAVSPEGDVALGGNYQGSIVIGADTLTSIDSFDAFIALFDGASGTPKWSRAMGGTGEQGIHGTTFDSRGNVILSGAAGPNVAALDPFLTKLDPKGNSVWSRTWNAPGAQLSTCVAADAVDNLLLGGHFIGGWSIGDTALESAGKNDAFIAKVGP